MAESTALERARLTIRGVRAELTLEDGHITLSKEGPPSTSLTFRVDQVRGTVLEPGSRGGRGWIHIAVVGGTLAPPGELAAMSDPYTLPLTPRSAVTARRLARIVEKHLHERGMPSEPVFAASALASGRFSSGVALTRAPGSPSPGPVVDLRTRDDAPLPDTRDAAPPPDTCDGSDTSHRAVEVAAAEAALDERAARDPATPDTDVPATDVPATDVPATDVPATDDVPATSTPSDPPPPGPPPAPSRGRALASELRELAELHTLGALTDAEFEQAKARVLG